MFVETFPAITRTLEGLRAPWGLWGVPAAALHLPRPAPPRGGPSAKPEGPRRPGGVGPEGPVGPRAGRPACVGRAGRAALFPSARQGRAVPRPPRAWRGRVAWAASPSCSWPPSRRRRRRTRHSCRSPRPPARPAGYVRRPPLQSSSPARPQLSAGAFGFSAVSRISAARRGPGKCAQVAVGSNFHRPPDARQCLGYIAGSAQLHLFLFRHKAAIKIIPGLPVLPWRHLIGHAVGAQYNTTFLPLPVQT